MPPLSGAAICFLGWLLGMIAGSTLHCAGLSPNDAVDPRRHGDRDRCACRLPHRTGGPTAPRPRTAADALRRNRQSAALQGAFPPTLLIRESFAEECDPELLRLVYAHEMTHLRRRDLWWGWLLTAGRLLFFFHPLVWLAKREWQFHHEAACDAGALETTRSSPKEFGRALLRVVTQHTGQRHDFAAVGIGESFLLLKRRIGAMAHFTPLARNRMILTGVMVLFIGAAILMPFKLGANAAPPAQFPNGTQPPPPIDHREGGHCERQSARPGWPPARECNGEVADWHSL